MPRQPMKYVSRGPPASGMEFLLFAKCPDISGRHNTWYRILLPEMLPKAYLIWKWVWVIWSGYLLVEQTVSQERQNRQVNSLSLPSSFRYTVQRAVACIGHPKWLSGCTLDFFCGMLRRNSQYCEILPCIAPDASVLYPFCWSEIIYAK